MKKLLCLFLLNLIVLNTLSKSVFEKINNLNQFKLSLKKRANVQKETSKTETQRANSQVQAGTALVPHKNVEHLSKNSKYDFRQFNLSNKMWYYHKRSAYIYNCTYVNYWIENYFATIRTPLEMSELSFTFQISFYYYGGGHNYNEYPGIEFEITMDNATIDSYKESDYQQGGYIFHHTAVLKGSLYNVVAGNHILRTKLKSTTSTVWTCIYPYSWMMMSIVGYPSTNK